ncbi:MAG: hypothetical protein K2X82_08380 [Gemmataceae bacterium]|nr:hypothetical protein [Gemmataceae bacterium]
MSDHSTNGKPAKAKRSVVPMDRLAAYRFYTWIDSRRDYIVNERKTLTQVAAEAALGFPVTVFHVRAAARSLKVKVMNDLRNNGTLKVAAVLEARMDALEEKFRKLAGRLGDLEAQLGVQHAKPA